MTLTTDEKRKNTESVFGAHLHPDERILWMGQPNPWRLLSWNDLLLVPFSLFWCAIAFTFVFVMPFGFLLPHVWIGVYLLFGRFAIDYVRRRHLYYAVTDQRVLILNTLFGRHFRSWYLSALAHLEVSLGAGYGRIIFERPTQHGRSRGISLSSEALGAGFYALPDAVEVYQLIDDLRQELQTQHMNALPDKPKRRF